MMLWGLWALLALHSPSSPAVGLGLAVLAAVLLVAVAAAGGTWLRPSAPAGVAWARARIRTYRIPRLSDPDAAGRPRPRAPSPRPAVI